MCGVGGGGEVLLGTKEPGLQCFVFWFVKLFFFLKEKNCL